MSGGGGEQTVTNTTEIPAYVEQGFQSIANYGDQLFRQGMGMPQASSSNPWAQYGYSTGFGGGVPLDPGASGGDTYFNQYVGPSNATLSGINALTQSGANGAPMGDQAMTAAGDILRTGGITAPGSNPYTSQIAGLAAGNDLQRSVASGDLIGANPHLDAVINSGIEDITGAVSSAANTRGLGGAGSTLMGQRVLGDSVADFVRDMRYGDYQNSLNTALGTASTLNAQGLAGLGTAAGLHGADADRSIGVQSQNVANQFGAMSALPGLAAYNERGIGQMLQAGALTEGYQQADLADQAAGHYFAQDRPWELLGNYGNAMGLAGSQPMATTSTGPAPPSNALLSGLGGAGAGAMLAGAVPALGPFALPLAGLGGIAGAFGL